MCELLKGKPLVDEETAGLAERSDALKEREVYPTLATVRVGGKDEDIAYEHGLKKRALATGVVVKENHLPEDIKEEELEKLITDLSSDRNVHGILVFEPLPEHINTEKIHKKIVPKKDVDGVTDVSMAAVYTGKKDAFAPCTAKSCVAILKHYGIELEGANVAVMGRSTVIGKPVSMLLTTENATVTICHSRTRNAAEICRNADILISCMGKGGYIDSSFTNKDQVIIDVGINFDEEGNIIGDVDFEDVCDKVRAITPVPGGVGSVTTLMLMQNVIAAAEEEEKKKQK